MEKMSNELRYKRYLQQGSTESIPRTTLARWKKKKVQKVSSYVTSVFAQVDEDSSNKDDSTNDEKTCQKQKADYNNQNNSILAEDKPTESLTDGDSVTDEEEDTLFHFAKQTIEETEESDCEFTDTPDPFLQNEDGVYNTATSSTPFLKNIVLLLGWQMKYNISDIAVDGLLQILNTICDKKVVPDTSYMFKKIFKDYRHVAQVHHLCAECKSYVGCIEENSTCHICMSEINSKTNFNIGNIFMHMPLAQQLKDLLENHSGIYEALFDSVTPMKNYKYEKISDGDLYKNMKKDNHNLLHSRNNFSLSFSCDGVPVFSSSGFSIWPILCTINELPQLLRKQHVLLTSLWFGDKKPDMNEFLQPFVFDCNSLAKDGFTYVINNEVKHSRVATIIGVCDSVARPLLQNTHQFNGVYGCGYCLHPGEVVPKGNGNVRVYPLSSEMFEKRTALQTIQYGDRAMKESNVIFGVKGPSILNCLSNFDIINGLVPDYMHCVLLGVARQFVSCWLDSKNHNKDFYIGLHIEIINEKLLSIKPPSSISRVPRTLIVRKFWKAHEWYAWVLYYSIPVLCGILPVKFLKHWSLLCKSLHILLSDSISKAEVYKVNQDLLEFVMLTNEIYGKEYVSFNVHLCSHLAESVNNWGPLWAHSAFIYESHNSVILEYVRSSHGVPHQICNRFFIQRTLPSLFKMCDNFSEEEKRLFLFLINEKKKPLQNVLKISNSVTALGKSTQRRILPDHRLALYCVIDVNNCLIDSVSYYERVIVNGEVIHSSSYKRVQKRNSYSVRLQNETFFTIETFIVVKENCLFNCYAIGKYLTQDSHSRIGTNSCNQFNFTHLIQLKESAINHLTAINVNQIKNKVVFLDFKTQKFICIQPNTCEMTD